MQHASVLLGSEMKRWVGKCGREKVEAEVERDQRCWGGGGGRKERTRGELRQVCERAA